MKTTSEITQTSANSQIEMEVWKPVVGWEELYEVSNIGRVRSIDRVCGTKHIQRKKGRLLKQHNTIRTGGRRQDEYPYKWVHMSRNCKPFRGAVHRLVAMAFVPNPNPTKFNQVNHKDENKSNNRADNLEWCDNRYNCNYGTHVKRAIENCPHRKVVRQYTLLGEFVKEHLSAAAAAKSVNIEYPSVINVCRGDMISAGGFLWRYANTSPEIEAKILKCQLRLENMMIVQMDMEGRIINIFHSLMDASRSTGLLRSGIKKALQRADNPKYRNYIWLRYSTYKNMGTA